MFLPLWKLELCGPKKLHEALHGTSTTAKITLGDAEEVLSESMKQKNISSGHGISICIAQLDQDLMITVKNVCKS